MISCAFEDGTTAFLRHVVVDTIVIKDDKLLLVKRSEKLSLECGKWALPGGFVDRDETTKDAAVREVFEETGYIINNVQLLTIRDNPDRPHEDRQNIAFVFLAEAGKKAGTSDWEVSEIQWFDLDNLPPENQIAFDHYQNIQLYLEYKKKKLMLPLFQ